MFSVSQQSQISTLGFPFLFHESLREIYNTSKNLEVRRKKRNSNSKENLDEEIFGTVSPNILLLLLWKILNVGLCLPRTTGYNRLNFECIYLRYWGWGQEWRQPLVIPFWIVNWSQMKPFGSESHLILIWIIYTSYCSSLLLELHRSHFERTKWCSPHIHVIFYDFFFSKIWNFRWSEKLQVRWIYLAHNYWQLFATSATRNLNYERQMMSRFPRIIILFCIEIVQS